MIATDGTNVELGWRIVTTGHDSAGKAEVRSDRSLTAQGISGVVRTDRPPTR
ncbi:MAG: hypothetical protein JWM34_557 [Ilumatobacteraceae bacterium]|nr:hypothetical protein [Ilumatobacteraceae bacterium]